MKRKEFDTPTKCRFYNAYDSREKGVSLRAICKRDDIRISPQTGSKWLSQRRQIGSLAQRRTRKLSTRLRRPYTVAESKLHSLLDPNHPHHKLKYDALVNAENLSITPHTLQQNFSKRIGAKRFKKPRVKPLSYNNIKNRIQYGKNHSKHTSGRNITNFWQWIYFTDESHFCSAELWQSEDYDLQIPNSQARLDQINEEEKPLLDVVVHVAAGITYNHKGPLLFYHDPAEPTEIKAFNIYNRTQPRKKKTESLNQFHERLHAWEARQPPEVEVQPKGNSMTLDFYTKNILSEHIKYIKSLQKRYKRYFYFQEDNDPSHGTATKDNAAYKLKYASGLALLKHPGQSPDLNCIEPVWNIMKEKLRGGRWRTVEEFKASILAAYKAVKQSQIRRRIKEMADRCKKLIIREGKRIKSNKW